MFISWLIVIWIDLMIIEWSFSTWWQIDIGHLTTGFTFDFFIFINRRSFIYLTDEIEKNLAIIENVSSSEQSESQPKA